MKYVVLTSTAWRGTSFFPTSLMTLFPLECQNPLKHILDEAEKQSLKVFVGAGYCFHNINEWLLPETDRLRHQLMVELENLYGNNPAFFGWYLPVESHISGHFRKDYLDYLAAATQSARKINPRKKILIAPFGTRDCIADDRYCRQLEEIDVDIIAYQDEVGVRKTKLDELEEIFSRIRKAHDRTKNAPALWADVEIFQFEGKVYNSALLPAPFERIKNQLKLIRPFVEQLLVYQCLGLMNPSGTSAFCGHPDSETLYRNYAEWAGIKS